MPTSQASVDLPTERQGDLVFDISTCPVESVVVFLDRAEVCRTIDAKVKQGDNEVVLRNVTSAADSDSIRVEGKGVATISEVSFQTKHVTANAVAVDATSPTNEGSQQEQARIEAELKQVERRLEYLNCEVERLATQQKVLDGFGDQLVEFADNEGVVALSKKQSLEGLDKYLKLYDKRVGELVDKRLDILEEVRLAEAKKASLSQNLRERSTQMKGKDQSSLTKTEREISILLDAESDGDVHLVVYYVVLHASWSPKYDVRTFVNDRTMQVHYFGVIKQSTNEDWRDARISLSTAVPSVGGTPPKITANSLTFSRPTYASSFSNSYKKKGKRNSMRRMRNARMAQVHSEAMRSAPPGAAGGAAHYSSEEDDVTEMAKPVAEVQTGAFSTAFDIEKPATIPADNTGHKVQVAILDFKPTFSYESVPKLSARAFLKASVKNESPYALLAGPTNIFLEGNFVAKSSLPAISPQEQFECSLGVDPSVRVTYKPVQRFREQGGIVSKTTTFKYRQLIEIKNTQQDNITIKVIDQLPLSTEEKIKVHLLAPELRKAERGKPLPSDAYPRLNSSNNIEWMVHVPSGKSEELLLRYSVEFPSDSRIQGL